MDRPTPPPAPPVSIMLLATALTFLLALIPATCSLRSDLTEARKDSAHWQALAGQYSRQSARLQAALITCMDNSTRIGR